MTTNIGATRTASHLPQAFFQPILTTFLSDFRVPEGFRRHILDARGESNRGSEIWVELKNSLEQKTWHVRIDIDCDWCLKDGWEEFTHDHHLQVGQLVVFNLVSSSTFLVSVFDALTNCEIYYPEERSVKDHPNKTVNVKVEYPEQGEEDSWQNKEMMPPHPCPMVKCKAPDHNEQGGTESWQNKEMKRPNASLQVKRKVPENTEEKEGSRQDKERKRPNTSLSVTLKVPAYREQGDEESRQDKEMKLPTSGLLMNLNVPEHTEQGEEKCKQNKEKKQPNACLTVKREGPEPGLRPFGNPYFCATVKKYCFSWPGMLIPIEFAKQHDLYRRWCNVILIDEIERKWMIHLRYRKTGKDQTYLAAGWDEFQAANDLKYGDKIALELISAGECPEMRFHKLTEAKQKYPT